MFTLSALWSRLISVKSRIERIEIPTVQLFLGDAQKFAESLVMHYFPFAQEPNGLTHIIVRHNPENIVVSAPGFLFWRDLVKTTYKNTRKNR